MPTYGPQCPRGRRSAWRASRSSRRQRDTYAMAVNDAGQVQTLDGYLWRRGHFTSVNPPADASSVTTLGLNNFGTVVGSTEHGAFVPRGGHAITLPRAPGDIIAFAEDVNDRGQIVGSSGVEEGYMRAVLWTR